MKWDQEQQQTAYLEHTTPKKEKRQDLIAWLVFLASTAKDRVHQLLMVIVWPGIIALLGLRQKPKKSYFQVTFHKQVQLIKLNVQ